LNRIYSAGFHDDHGTYIDPRDFEPADPALRTVGVEQAEGSSRLDDEGEKKDEEGLEEVESQDHEPSVAGDGTDRAAQNGALENAASLRRQQSSKSTRSQRERDPNMVSWNGPEDPENPKNWKMSRKWTATIVVSSFVSVFCNIWSRQALTIPKTFISPVASSMVAPALTDMSRDLGVNNTVESQMMLSIFILAYAFGPLLLGPLSEVYGRVPVLQLANLFFLVFNLVCGFAQTSAQMLVFRFLAGLGGSAPLSIGGGILADCFTAEQRGKAIAIYSLAPLIGPAAGPVAGGFIAGNISWRWVFWIVSIADAAVQISGLFFLQETWAPKLLEAKARRLRE